MLLNLGTIAFSNSTFVIPDMAGPSGETIAIPSVCL